jgi:hypothetical protein
MYILVFKKIVADLTSMEVKFDDEDLSLLLLLLLCSIPATYNNYTILYSHNELTMAEVYEALLKRKDETDG